METEITGPPVVVVDASNVANSAPSARARLEYLRLVLRRLEAEGVRTIVVADASLERRIDERAAYLGMVERGEVIVAPAAMQADELILRLARDEGARVVSNDRFREWASLFGEEIARRVGFRVRDGVAELRGM